MKTGKSRGPELTEEFIERASVLQSHGGGLVLAVFNTASQPRLCIFPSCSALNSCGTSFKFP